MNRFRVYAQLVRLPNLPTALADICLAALALAVQPASGDLVDGFRFDRLVLLLLASACLYSSGMAWNDYFDQEQDRRERPFRPLPSAHGTRRASAYFAVALLIVGLILSLLAGWQATGSLEATLPLSADLIATILLYHA